MNKTRQCGDKRQHDTKHSAMAHRADLIAKGAFPGRIWAYRCGVCKHWHVGHNKRRRRSHP